MCLYGVFEPYYYQHNYQVELKRTSSVIYGNEIHANKGSVFVGAGHIESGNADALLFNAPRPLEFLYYTYQVHTTKVDKNVEKKSLSTTEHAILLKRRELILVTMSEHKK